MLSSRHTLKRAMSNLSQQNGNRCLQIFKIYRLAAPCADAVVDECVVNDPSSFARRLRRCRDERPSGSRLVVHAELLQLSRFALKITPPYEVQLGVIDNLNGGTQYALISLGRWWFTRPQITFND